jgi:hypothetical protein
MQNLNKPSVQVIAQDTFAMAHLSYGPERALVIKT